MSSAAVMKCCLSAGVLLVSVISLLGSAPSLEFQATTKQEAIRWQRQSRDKLFGLLMGGTRPRPVDLKPEVLQRIEVSAGGYVLEELTIQSLPDRRAHVWLATPKAPKGKVGAVLAIHGHGGSGEEVVRGLSLYWYGRAMAEMGYVVIAPDVGQHELQHTNWTLMGERVWDSLRCLDYLETRHEVDPKRIAVAGLSLGGETTMYVAALDERVKAVCSSGWLTTVENMKDGHCPCWNFPGLEEHFDFADIFACVAPRPLVLELGTKERAPGGFPVEIGRKAFARIKQAYRVFGAEDKVLLDLHPAGHVFRGAEFWKPLQHAIGTAWPWNPVSRGSRSPGRGAAEEALRRGEIARRCFARALGVVDGWWATRDPKTGLFPRRVDQLVWAPNDNAADMLPFLLITSHHLAPERKGEILQALDSEKKLTSRLGALPDWYSITDRAFIHTNAEIGRMIFCAAEYCKDGLVPMTEVMGDGPWVGRMVELMDAIFEHAPVNSDFGPLPSNDAEVNGDLLQALTRLYSLKRDEKHLKWAQRLGDAYCLEVLPNNGGLPPHRWDFTKHEAITDTLNINDHGNEIIGGLAELFVMTKHAHPEKARQYEPPLQQMFHRLLDKARNADGLWFSLVRASTVETLNQQTPDTWGYALSAAITFGSVAGDSSHTEAARLALQRINQPRYLDWNGADSYADSVEGALLLLNRIPEREGFIWLEKMLPLFLGKQRDDGIVEGWYGDGNYARTAVMAALYFTQGAVCRPWRADVRLGAVRDGETIRIAVAADADWNGELQFDTPRHRLHMGLPVNYARLNEFPEWFTLEADATYRIQTGNNASQLLTGKLLGSGLPLQCKGDETVSVVITRTN